MQTRDVAWLAGIVEGEGYIGLGSGKYPLISVGMTDLDIVERIHSLWGTRRNKIGCHSTQNPSKPVFIVQVNGGRAVGWLMTMFPFLGKRRRKKATEVISVWRNHTAKRLRRKGNPEGNQGSIAGLLGGSREGR